MQPQRTTGATRIDPVCGMTVDPKSAAGSIEHKGETYYFCSKHCLHKFSEDPQRFLNQSTAPHTMPAGDITRATATSVTAEGVAYTCPMHPEIVRDKPGSCPICGMALELRTITLDEEENPELVDMTRRFWISVALTLPLVLIGMSEMIPGAPLMKIASMEVWGWVQLFLATPVVLWGGWPFFVRAWNSVVNRSLNMFTLIGMGVSVAYVFSVVAQVFPAEVEQEIGKRQARRQFTLNRLL